MTPVSRRKESEYRNIVIIAQASMSEMAVVRLREPGVPQVSMVRPRILAQG